MLSPAQWAVVCVSLLLLAAAVVILVRLWRRRPRLDKVKHILRQPGRDWQQMRTACGAVMRQPEYGAPMCEACIALENTTFSKLPPLQK